MTINVRDIGAKRDGIEDHSLAIQTAIDATIGIRSSGAPIPSLVPNAPLYFSTGVWYNLTKGLRIAL